MEKPLAPPDGKRARGNPNWGKPLLPVPALRTEFEMEVARLRLQKSQYVDSAELKQWCDRNRNRVYVPEWLLTEWRMKVETEFGRAA
jgi:hypothetical protein